MSFWGSRGVLQNATSPVIQSYFRIWDFRLREGVPDRQRTPVNALLSYGYSVLHRNIIGAIERHGRSILILDLCIDFRAGTQPWHPT